jgi:hypothetical protein
MARHSPGNPAISFGFLLQGGVTELRFEKIKHEKKFRLINEFDTALHV